MVLKRAIQLMVIAAKLHYYHVIVNARSRRPISRFLPAVSSDGKTLASMSARAANADVWLEDLKTRRKTLAAAQVGFGQHPTIARDGSMLLFGGSKPGAEASPR